MWVKGMEIILLSSVTVWKVFVAENLSRVLCIKFYFIAFDRYDYTVCDYDYII